MLACPSLSARDRRIVLACACLGVWLALLLTGWVPPWGAFGFLAAGIAVFPWRRQ
jgi:hypothetical protein